VARAVPTTTGVLIQFPLYGSIAAILTQVKGVDEQTLAHTSRCSSPRSPPMTPMPC
jgi:short subunit fatty acids transporter